jgi:monoamine oxidase
MAQTIPVIIIGAGISGIAASSVLSKSGIRHIILESRSRIGGRILTTNFNEDSIELGAYLVHHPS